MVGVTGSAGKTTTSWLVRSIFEELGQLTGMLGEAQFLGVSKSGQHQPSHTILAMLTLSVACGSWRASSLCHVPCATCSVSS